MTKTVHIVPATPIITLFGSDDEDGDNIIPSHALEVQDAVDKALKATSNLVSGSSLSSVSDSISSTSQQHHS
jgi:hypothetical protein